MQTVQLLAEVPWTNLPCEQLHGSLATFRKWQSENGTTSLVARALMHQFVRGLSPEATKTEKEVAKLERQIKKVAAKNPEKGSAMSTFLSEVWATLKRNAGEDSAGPLDFDFAKLTLKQAAAQYLTLSLHEHQQLLTKARNGVAAKKQELKEQLEALEAKHQALLEQLTEEQESAPPCLHVCLQAQ